VTDAGGCEHAGNQHVAGHEHGPRSERERREREPQQNGDEDQRVAAPHLRPRRVRVGTEHEEQRAEYREEL
jgi:hypothetical protein